jgi:hypothetical protein
MHDKSQRKDTTCWHMNTPLTCVHDPILESIVVLCRKKKILLSLAAVVRFGHDRHVFLSGLRSVALIYIGMNEQCPMSETERPDASMRLRYIY